MTAPSLSSARHPLLRLVGGMTSISKVMAILAGASVLLLALFMVVDIINRHLGAFYSGATDEIAGYALSFSGSWSLAYTLAMGRHVSIDVLSPWFTPAIRRILLAISLFTVALLGGLIAYYGTLLALDSLSFDARSVSVLRTPLWIPQLLMAAGFAALALQALAMLLATIFVVAVPVSASSDTQTFSV